MVKLLLGKGGKLEDAAFFHSFKEVHFQIIKYLLERGANPKETDDYGNTMLHRQCEIGNLKNVKYLIQHYSADVSAKNKRGQTPLHLACTSNNNLKIVKYLIEEQNADPTVTCNEGKTAIHNAAKNENPIILRYLIEEQKQGIEATDSDGKTALHMACQNELGWETQKYMIHEHPKIIEAKDKEGKTALHNFLKTIEELEEYGEYPNHVSFEFRSLALILATKAEIVKERDSKETDIIFDWIKQSYANDMEKSKGEDEAISCLITGLNMFHKQYEKKYTEYFEFEQWLSENDQKRIKFNPLLYIVNYCNRVDIAEYMFNQDLGYIEKHFNADEAKSKRILLLKSYLEFSCGNGLLDLTRFVFQEINNRQESFQYLNFDGSFLKIACKNKHFKIFKYLIEYEKAKDEASEFLKDFPLHYACQYGSLEMVQYLIETKQIDIELKDNKGRTPLHLACRAGSIEIAKYLIEKQNANINTSDNIGRSPLHSACIIGSIEIVRYLIENHNANMNTTDYKGRSVWHFACLSGYFEIVKKIEIVKYISQKTKQDVNAQDEDGSTVLHVACKRRWPNLKNLLKFLITEMKANLHLVDKEGRTPLHVHCQSSGAKVPIAKFLVNKGANVLVKDNIGKSPLQIAKSKFGDTYFKTEIKELITFLQAATKR
jgi:ankyrin repeat protein